MKNPSTGLFNSLTATYMLISISIFCYVLYVYWLPHGLLLNIVRGHLRITTFYCSRTFIRWIEFCCLFFHRAFQYICSGLVFQIGIQCYVQITCMFVKIDANRYKNCIIVLQNRIVLGCLKQCEASLIYSYSDLYYYLPKAKNCYSSIISPSSLW